LLRGIRNTEERKTEKEGKEGGKAAIESEKDGGDTQEEGGKEKENRKQP